MAKEAELTWGEIYKDFCNWSPEHAAMVVDYRPWGSTSIVVWLNNGQAYKCKRHAADSSLCRWCPKRILRRNSIYKIDIPRRFQN